MRAVLTNILDLLREPNIEDALDPVQHDIWKNDKTLYNRTLVQLVNQHAFLSAEDLSNKYGITLSTGTRYGAVNFTEIKTDNEPLEEQETTLRTKLATKRVLLSTSLANYQIVKLLSQGAEGIVYEVKCSHPSLQAKPPSIVLKVQMLDIDPFQFIYLY